MAQDLTVADSQPVVDLLQGYRRSKAMFAGVQLGVFDALEKGAQTSEQLSHSLKCNAEALERLLCALVGLQLLARQPDGYCNTATSSTYLTSTSPRRLTGYINYSNAVGWQLWGHLEDAIREGSNRWKQCFGWDEPIFSSFFKTEDAANEFLMGMHGFGRVSSPAVVNALDLSRFKHLVDLGGATGHLAIAACERYSTLQATVFDLPAARPLAEKIIAESQVGQRVRVVSGDFFTDELPQADLFALGRIIHDWSEPKVLLLLRRLCATTATGSLADL